MAHKLDVPSMWSEQMGAVVAKQNELAKDAYSTDQSIEEMRQAYRSERRFWNEGGPHVESAEDRMVPTRHGSIPVRRYVPQASEEGSIESTRPLIVYVHGGGWLIGDVDTHDRITRTIASLTGAIVVSVGYTLSPEAQYPQPIEEISDVTDYIVQHAQEWGIDPQDVSFSGDSAGANMAFGALLYLRDHGKAVNARSMLLFYGAYGLRDSRSMRLLGGPWDGLTEADYEYYLKAYLGGLEKIREPYVNILDNDLSSAVPPCFIVAAGLDPLKDDSEALHELLDIAGVDNEFVVYPKVIHAFLHHSRMLDDTMDAMRRAADFFRSHKI